MNGDDRWLNPREPKVGEIVSLSGQYDNVEAVITKVARDKYLKVDKVEVEYRVWFWKRKRWLQAFEITWP